MVPEGETSTFKLELPTLANVMGVKDAAPSAGKQPTDTQLVNKAEDLNPND